MTAIDAMDHSPVWTLNLRVWAGLFCVYGGGRNDPATTRNSYDLLRRNGPQLRRNSYAPRARKRQTYKSLILARSLLRDVGLRDKETKTKRLRPSLTPTRPNGLPGVKIKEEMTWTH